MILLFIILFKLKNQQLHDYTNNAHDDNINGNNNNGNNIGNSNNNIVMNTLSSSIFYIYVLLRMPVFCQHIQWNSLLSHIYMATRINDQHTNQQPTNIIPK